MKPDFSKENSTGKAVAISPGVWVCGKFDLLLPLNLAPDSRISGWIGEVHSPGGVENIKINNRAFVFQLTLENSLGGVPAGQDVLFVYGLGKDGAIKGVKNLEKSTGLKAVALLCNGGGHHLQIEKWYIAFPEMRVWVCPTKVPQTDNGERLRSVYPERWELVDNTSTRHHVHQLLHYFGSGENLQVDCIVFNQLNLYKDKTSQAAGIASLGTYKDKKTSKSLFAFMKGFAALSADLSCPIDDVVFYHKATKMAITGHHFAFAYIPKDSSGHAGVAESQCPLYHHHGSLLRSQTIVPKCQWTGRPIAANRL